MATKKKRRKYSKEFEAEAVKIVLERGLTRAQAVNRLRHGTTPAPRSWDHDAFKRSLDHVIKALRTP